MLYLEYEDDRAAGTLPAKTVNLVIVNARGRSAPDTETVRVDLRPPAPGDSTGIWRGNLPLRDAPAASRDGAAQFRILGEATATVLSHDKAGRPDGRLQASLRVAYPDSVAWLRILPHGGAGTLSRASEGVLIRLQEQSLSSGVDSVQVTLSCSQTGDRLSGLLLVETEPGRYASALVPKREGSAANPADGILTCGDRDLVKVVYEDPVHGTRAEAEARQDAPVEARFHYALTVPDGPAIQVVHDSAAGRFYAVVAARSPRLDALDTLEIAMATPHGEREVFPAVETAPRRRCRWSAIACTSTRIPIFSPINPGTAPASGAWCSPAPIAIGPSSSSGASSRWIPTNSRELEPRGAIPGGSCFSSLGGPSPATAAPGNQVASRQPVAPANSSHRSTGRPWGRAGLPGRIAERPKRPGGWAPRAPAGT